MVKGIRFYYMFCICCMLLGISAWYNTIKVEAAVKTGNLPDSMYSEFKLSGDYQYRVVDQGDGTPKYATLSGYFGKDKIVKLPSKIGGYAVKTVWWMNMSYGWNLEESKDQIGRENPKQEARLKKIKKIIVPDGIEVIAGGAFQSLYNLQEIILPDSIRYIEAGAFQDCIKLQRVTIPPKVKKIENSTFSGCIAVREVILGPRVKKIEREAFLACDALKDIKLPSSLKEIEFRAFYCCGIERLEIPSSATCVGRQENMRQLKKLVWNAKDPVIKQWSFNYSTKLREVTFAKGVTTFEKAIFPHCDNLKIIRVPDSVKHIRMSQLKNCTKATFYCSKKSSMYRFAKSHNLKYKLV